MKNEGYDQNLEMNPLKADQETSQNEAGYDMKTAENTWENSPCQNEFFPNGEQGNKKEKDKKKGTLAKMLAASLSLVAAVATVAIATFPPTPILPTAGTVAVTAFREEVYDEGDPADPSDDVYTPPAYDIAFSFSLNGATPQYVEIEGTSTTPIFEGTDNPVSPESQPISATLSNDALITDENDNLSAVYTVEDAYQVYNLTATLYYTMKNEETGEMTEGQVKTEVFEAAVPQLYVAENDPLGGIEATMDGDMINCDFTFRDFRAGCFEYRVESIVLYVQEEEIYLDPPLPALVDGAIKFSYAISKPQSDSVVVEAEVRGDSYFNGQKMNMPSSAFLNKEIIWGTTYTVATPTYSSALKVNGLTLKEVNLLTDYTGYIEQLDMVLPGRTVWCSVILEGVAEKDGAMTLHITTNTGKITELDLSYAENMTVYKGDQQIVLEFCFTMPEEDILAEDIVITDITFTEV